MLDWTHHFVRSWVGITLKFAHQAIQSAVIGLKKDMSSFFEWNACKA